MTKAEKHHHGKPMAGLVMVDFPRALLGVAEVATFGYRKYNGPSGWLLVDDAIRLYSDAKSRHLLAQGIELYDEESNLLHLAHEAWNALAVLELTLRDGAKLAATTDAERTADACTRLITSGRVSARPMTSVISDKGNEHD